MRPSFSLQRCERLRHNYLYNWVWLAMRSKYELSWNLPLKRSCWCYSWDGKTRFSKDYVFRRGIWGMSFVCYLVRTKFVRAFIKMLLLWETLRRKFCFFHIYPKHLLWLPSLKSNSNDWQWSKSPFSIFYNSTSSLKATLKWN